MKKLHNEDLLSLETYGRERTGFRERIMEHRHTRSIELGPQMTLFFEDRWTIQYQAQERLRDENIEAPDAIEAVLAAYNPLIPDGHNWKATCVIDIVAAQAAQLDAAADLVQRVWVRVGDRPPVFAHADETRVPADRADTLAAHCLRFELDHAEIADLHHGARVDIGVDHDAYRHSATASEALRQALTADLRETEGAH